MFEAIKEMKQSGLTNADIVLEFLGAVGVFAIPISLMFISELFA